MGADDGCKANIANQLNNQALKIAIDNSDIEDEKHKYSLIKTYILFLKPECLNPTSVTQNRDYPPGITS